MIARGIEFFKNRYRSILTGVGLGICLGLLHGLSLVIISGEPPLGRIVLVDSAIGLLFFIGVGVYFRLTLDARRRIEAQLSQLSRAVEQSPSMVIITDVQGAIEYVNPKFSELTGYTLDEVRGRSLDLLRSGDTPPEELTRRWQTILSRGEWHGEVRNARKNGELFWTQSDIVPIKTPDGAITHYLTVTQDITARKQAEASEREQRLLAEALRDAVAVLNSSLDLDTVLDRVLQGTDSVLPHDAADIMLIDEDGIARVTRVCAHLDAGQAETMLTWSLPVDTTRNLRDMIRTGQPLVTPDTWNDPDWVKTDATTWIRSHAAAPILREGNVRGFINLNSTKPGFFTHAHGELLKAFADQAAIAIQNARLFAAEREQHILAEALRDTATTLNNTLSFDALLDRILENVGRVVLHDAAVILLIEDGVARVVRCHGYPTPQQAEAMLTLRLPVEELAALGQIITTRQPVIIDEDAATPGDWIALPANEGLRSHCAAPIRLYGAVIGILVVNSTRAGAFRPADAERLLVFADQAAIAIQNAQLYDALRDQARELAQRVKERTVELDRQRAQLAAILDGISEGVAYIVDGQVRYTNTALAQLLGTDPPHLLISLNELHSRFFPGDDLEQSRREASKQFKLHGNWHTRKTVRRIDGSTFEALLIVTLLRGPDREQIGSVTLLRDVSREIRLQEQKDRFLAHAAHELRTPISNIKTRLYLLRKQPAKLERHLDVMEQVSNGMMELAEDLLDVVRFQRNAMLLHKQSVVLQDLISNSLEMQLSEAEQRHIWLVYEMPDEPITVCADWRRMGQVITKLVTNALHHTPENGHVVVQLSAEEREDGPCALIQVRDSGPGIEANLLDQVFEPFFRVNEADSEGVGLGLAISREIVTRHGGEIWVESDGGQGCVFSVRLTIEGACRDDNHH